MAGKIITIEGLDGAGKSTQIDLLINFMEDNKIPFKFIHFPMLNQGYYGKLIAQFLRGEFGSLDDVHPQLVALLFAEDRNEHKPQLLDWLNKGFVILMDRYVTSNIAFQCAKLTDQVTKDKLKDWINDFEFGNNELPIPELSLFLHVPFQQIEKSLQQVRTGADRDYLDGATDIHEDSIDFQRKVYEEYLKLMATDANLKEVVCFDQSNNWLRIEEIHSRVIDYIKPYLSEWLS